MNTHQLGTNQKMKNKPSDYKHIAVWGKRLGSFAYYINDQQHKAAEAGAPINAIYEKYDHAGPSGVWVTADEIVCAELRAEVNEAARKLAERLARAPK